MKLAVYRMVGQSNVPHDVRDLRERSLESHRKYGEPIIHKHRWTEKDYREGRAQLCPLHDNWYDADRQWDTYCFGTGFLGGFDDGKIMFLTIGDAPRDEFRISASGVLIHQETPGMVAPWYPDLADGDLIIRAIFEPNHWDVIDVGDRFLLEEVTPVHIRGYEERVQAGRRGEFKVAQNANISKLPFNHPLYQVPIVFDYGNVPDVDPQHDPSDYPVGTKFFAVSQGIRIAGKESHFVYSVERGIRLAVAGTLASAEAGIRLKGKARGVVIDV